MPIEYPVEFKHKVIQRYEKGESIKDLSQEFHIRFTIGINYSVLFRRRGIPTHPKRLMRFHGNWRSWSMSWRSSAFPDTLLKCRFAGNLKCWKRYTMKINSSAYMSYARPWGLPGALFTITYFVVQIGANVRKRKRN